MFGSWTVSAVLLLYFMQKSGYARLIYTKVGDSVVLHPGQTFSSMSTITWKHNMNNIMEWSGADVTCLRSFIGRCGLDKSTGSLIINNLTVDDTGNYNPEIDSKMFDQIELWVIIPVPKPTVSIECNRELSSCDLTCKANITSHFGPVTYRWESGDKLLSSKIKLSLTANNVEPSYVCMLLNPFSNSSSDEVRNPIKPRRIHPAALAVPVLIVVLTLVAIGGYIRHKKEQKQAQNVEEPPDETPAIPLKPVRENGRSLESIESIRPTPAPVRRFSSARELYLQDDEERWVENHPEYRKLSRELREFRLQRDL
ncbi:lymphocyte function-associated antigen 3-like [Gambusia affinis]|uniref:lymphocyte function-associated antigen 3-like n=1 Tax=Gambusia affinis TaxID=33528 RepID=UPI001CDC25E8|nr:lymphocyte function-associated antigen 3-like [Gambusia affinis]XP_043965638.1 lymphocyte function-associated antigen 3-like [Gambusia affinis]